MFRLLIGAFAAIWLTSCVSPASAGSTFITYISGVAPPNNTTCTRTSPCNTLAAALTQTAPTGTVVCVDPIENQAPLTITVPVTIDCSAAPLSITNGETSVGNNPTLAATLVINVLQNATSNTVRLIGVRFYGGGGDQTGLTIVAAGAVHIENSKFENFIHNGVADIRTGGQTKLFIKDSEIRQNGGVGVLAASQAVGITVLDNVSLENNLYGVAAGTGNNVIINRSVISGNPTAGVEADTGASIEVTNTVVSHNNIGIQAGGTIRLRENDIAFSNTAVQGNTVSLGANRFFGNGAVGTTPSAASGAAADVFN